MNGIYIYASTLIYLVIGLLVCLLFLRKTCNDRRINTRNKTMDQFANDHALEVLGIVFAWPLYLVALLLCIAYVRLSKKWHK